MTTATLERALEVAMIGAVAWPAVRACASPSFWRAFPRIAGLLAGVLAAGAGGLAVVAVAAPAWGLRCLAGAGLGLLLVVHWHSTTARGRRWPPGSLRPLPLGPWFDRRFFFEQHRRYGSPFKTCHFMRPMACFVGLSRGVDFLREHEASLGSPPLPVGRFIPGGFLRHMTPEAHADTKDVFRAALVREVYEPLEPFMRATIRAELARMEEASIGSGGQGVPPRRHIQRAVFAMWARLFFHVAPGTADFARLQARFKIIDVRNPARASDGTVRAALAEITELLRRQRAAAPSADGETPRSFLDAMAKNRPDAVENPTVIGNLIYLMHFSWSDLSGLLVWVFRMLTEHPEWVERLRAAPTGAGGGDAGGLPLSTRVVLETLRLEQSEHLYRVANRAIEHDGFVIPRGWLVRLCVRESHRDPAVFENPEAFDPDRFLRRTYSRREYSPFGAGLRHACLGEGLTRSVGHVFVEELASAFAWRTVADGAYEYSAWRHWRPSSRWRVLVTPPAALRPSGS